MSSSLYAGSGSSVVRSPAPSSPTCRSVLGRDTEPKQLLMYHHCVNVCEWVNLAVVYKRFEWLIRLETSYITTVRPPFDLLIVVMLYVDFVCQVCLYSFHALFAFAYLHWFFSWLYFLFICPYCLWFLTFAYSGTLVSRLFLANSGIFSDMLLLLYLHVSHLLFRYLDIIYTVHVLAWISRLCNGGEKKSYAETETSVQRRDMWNRKWWTVTWL